MSFAVNAVILTRNLHNIQENGYEIEQDVQDNEMNGGDGFVMDAEAGMDMDDNVDDINGHIEANNFASRLIHAPFNSGHFRFFRWAWR